MSAYHFFKKIDQLLGGFASWNIEFFEAVRDELDEGGQPCKETVVLWRRNPIDCIKELIGNPMF